MPTGFERSTLSSNSVARCALGGRFPVTHIRSGTSEITLSAAGVDVERRSAERQARGQQP
jgi:hypothetical protein